ncbi:MAG TPA: DAK2 domain-containing protein [Actinomycetota bacterium]|nr:DAK2 domain-containing protein [Actinomycetota bacterium]
MELFRHALETHRDHLNSLNVYPVPDGDTGTNLLLTQQAVTSALESSAARMGFEPVTAAVTRASLMGARGNSGVILSQVLRGVCEAVGQRRRVGGRQLAASLEHATHEAYRAVTKPAEGTMLSVLRDATAAAMTASTNDDSATVLNASLDAARASLNRTRMTNPALRQAGVIDAGGKGVVLLLDALLSAMTGEPMTEPVGSRGPVGTQTAETSLRVSELEYEVQYLLHGDTEVVTELREALDALGESVVVVGGGGLFNVHVHTDDPKSVIHAGERRGALHDVSVVPLQEQVEACLAGQARAVRVAEQTSMVALADGDGVVRALESMGALVVPGGGRPSQRDVVAAINTAPADSVLVLPAFPEAVPVAEGAASESSKRSVVVPTRSVPAALSAAATFSPVAEAEENLRSMKEVLTTLRAGEISRSTHARPSSRNTENWIGVGEERLLYTGPSLEAAAEAVISHLLHSEAELLTLVVGSSVRRDDEEAVVDAIGRVNPSLRIERIADGPQRQAFLVGVE